MVQNLRKFSCILVQRSIFNFQCNFQNRIFVYKEYQTKMGTKHWTIFLVFFINLQNLFLEFESKMKSFFLFLIKIFNEPHNS